VFGKNERLISKKNSDVEYGQKSLNTQGTQASVGIDKFQPAKHCLLRPKIPVLSVWWQKKTWGRGNIFVVFFNFVTTARKN